jgi:hypothetical protein
VHDIHVADTILAHAHGLEVLFVNMNVLWAMSAEPEGRLNQFAAHCLTSKRV